MCSYGFIITRHVNSVETNKYWNHSLRLLNKFYPNTKIVVIDDNSNQEFVKSEAEYNNVEFIQSEFPGRGELLPYYYYLKTRYFDNAVIIHDSVFFHKKLAFEKLCGMKVLPLWHFEPFVETPQNTMSLASTLKNNMEIRDKLVKNIMSLPHKMWNGCFGVQTYINHTFLLQIEEKYNITNLIHYVKNREDRCCLERIFGCIFTTECPPLLIRKSVFGDIMTYQKWGHTFEEYINNLNRKIIAKLVVKVWTGR